MKSLADLKKEIAVLKEKKEETAKMNKFLEVFKSTLEKALNNKEFTFKNEIELKGLEDKLDELIKKENPTEIKISNFPAYPEQKEFPKEIKISNQKEIVIPKFPTKIDIKEPKWFSFKGVIDAVKELKKSVDNKKEIDIDQYKRKSNAIAVRLVTQDGDKFYNAGGNGGGATVDNSRLAKEETLQEFILNSKLSGIDDGEPTYIGYVKKDGSWLIQRIENSSTVKYTKGASDFATNWSGRSTLTYNYYNLI